MEKMNPVEMCDMSEVHEALIEKINRSLHDEDDIYDLAELFKIFGDSSRIRILCVLSVSEVCVCDLAAVLNMTQSAVSHQLRILKANRLIKGRREGKQVFYSLDDEHVRSIIAAGMEHLKEED